MHVKDSPDPRKSMWAWMAFELRKHRNQRGQTGHEVAKILGCVKSSISRLESGAARLDERQAALLDEAWQTGGTFGIMLWYAQMGHDPDWFKQHVEFEQKATILKLWELAWLPGLLQTEDYARAALVANCVKNVDQALEGRTRRQGILTRPEPPILWALVAEAALRAPVGGAEVMRAQLRHLLEVSQGPDISIRVVPAQADAHPGMDGAFKVMSVAGGDVAYVEAPGGGRLVSSVSQVHSFHVRYDRIGQVALPAGPSRDLIKEAMEGIE